MSTYLFWMGWNEVLARIFDGFDTERNVSPPWLLNPATRRRLKLDLMYPEVGVAVRFVGAPGKGRGRQSDWEALDQASRDETRKELCRLNQVDLMLINTLDAFPKEQLKQVRNALSGASRRIAKKKNVRNKGELMERLAMARSELETLVQSISKPDDLAAFADLWRDREHRMVEESQMTESVLNAPRKHNGQVPNYQIGQYVQHAQFGRGGISNVENKDGEVFVTVNFTKKGVRTFLASLVADKLIITRS